MAAKKRPGPGRKPRDYAWTRKTLDVPDAVLERYKARIQATGNSINAELLTAIRRHVGLE